MKIAFIGTFNPITTGHLLMAQTTVNKIENTGLIFVPVSDYYIKNELTTQAKHRVEMISLATKDNKKFIVENIELKFAEEMKRQPSTIETMFLLKDKYLEDIGLLIGTDNFITLHEWVNADDLVKNFKIIVYPRDGFDDFNKEDQQLYSKYPEQFVFVDTKLTTNVSASEIRENFREGKSNQYMVPDIVLKYIHQQYYLLDYCIKK